MKIMGIDYKIDKGLTKTELGKKFGFSENCRGVFSSGDRTIFVARDLEKDRQVQTLVHEIIEALNYHLNLGLTHHSKIKKLDEGLTRFFRENNINIENLLDK